MLSMLRSAGARGVTRGELFDGIGVGNPSHLVDVLTERGHTIMELPEEHNGGQTSRFTLMVDGAEQRTIFEGDATDELGTWREDPVQADELKQRQLAKAR